MYKKHFILLSMMLIFISLSSVKAASIEAGVKAPQFNIKTGDDKDLSFSSGQSGYPADCRGRIAQEFHCEY
jgi:hypothetical protein